MTALLLSTVTAAVLGQAPPPLPPAEAEWRPVATEHYVADRAPYGDPETPQDIANALVVYLGNGRRPDGISTRDYLTGRHAEELAGPVGWPLDGLAPLPEYVIACESGGNPRAVNRRSGAGGLAQFLVSTWWSMGGRGLPQDAPEAEQRWRAALLWDFGRGRGQWECAA